MEASNVFGKRLLGLREERGLSLEEVATAVGITKSTLSKYEKGKNEPGMMIAKRLADFFNVSLDWIIGCSDEKDPLNDDDLSRIFSSLPENEKKDVLTYIMFLKSKREPKE